MSNRGQTTVFFSLMISVLLLLTFTALEVARIRMSRVKAMAGVHSMRSNVMADYNRELFERYHLLFMDPTYGTESYAALEEKMADYLEVTLNGESAESGIYQFSIEDVAVVESQNILDGEMQQVKKQIADYEKTAGIVNHVSELFQKEKQGTDDISSAVAETETNGVEMELPKEDGNEQPDADNAADEERENTVEVQDPREQLEEALKFGILEFILPGNTISKEEYNFREAPSTKYSEQYTEEILPDFQDISIFKKYLAQQTEADYGGVTQRAAYVDYVNNQFSNIVDKRQGSALDGEVEYILKGKSSDYENLEAVVHEIVSMRLPVNYAYLLTDTEKKSEALTMAAAMCTASGTTPLIEVVKYLLLGCWSYGETLYEVRQLLSGEQIAYIKTAAGWQTDLKTLAGTGTGQKVTDGLSYRDYLQLLLVKRSGSRLNMCYARMLDIMQENIRQTDPDFRISDCIGGMTMQGEVEVNEVYLKGTAQDIYQFYFEEEFSY